MVQAGGVWEEERARENPSPTFFLCFDPFGSFAAERSVAVFLLRRALPSLAMCLLTRMVAGGRNDIV